VFTFTPIPAAVKTDIFYLDKNLLNLSKDQSVSIFVQTSVYPGEYNLRIYDTAGEHILTLDSRNLSAPLSQSYHWDGRNKNGELCASGVYIFYLIEPTSRKVKKILLAR